MCTVFPSSTLMYLCLITGLERTLPVLWQEWKKGRELINKVCWRNVSAEKECLRHSLSCYILAVAFKWESYLVLEAWNSTEFASSLWIKKKNILLIFNSMLYTWSTFFPFLNFFLIRMDLFFLSALKTSNIVLFAFLHAGENSTEFSFRFCIFLILYIPLEIFFKVYCTIFSTCWPANYLCKKTCWISCFRHIFSAFCCWFRESPSSVPKLPSLPRKKISNKKEKICIFSFSPAHT